VIASSFLSRQARFERVASTNDVVRAWLEAGVPEVCLAIADEQTAGRGREGRRWVAPPGRALLLSLGFRPTWLEPERLWRLPATVSLAMADAAEEAAGLPDGMIRLKWPNDLVVEAAEAVPETAPHTAPDTRTQAAPASVAPGTAARPSLVRKLAGVLGETDGIGGDDPRAVVGLGIDTDWPAAEFPPDLAGSMTSLREASGGRPVDPITLVDGFTSRLEARIEALRAGRFDLASWRDRQVTTGRVVRLELPGGGVEEALAIDVDARSGALVLEAASGAGERHVTAGDVRIRLAEGAV
jgi:BirA family biotin operon repressor/biotin-[acetyl-CoA-carboxylase] ligase